MNKKDGALWPEEEDGAYLHSGIDTDAYWRVERARLEERNNRAIRQRKRKPYPMSTLACGHEEWASVARRSGTNGLT